jgi:hypothetical protein
MTITVTQINYSDIDQTIFEEMFLQDLPSIDADIPNMVWEPFGEAKSSSNAAKLVAVLNHFETCVPIIYKVDIDGYIVMYGSGRRETGGRGMFCQNVDMMRSDASDSNSWIYTMEWNEAIDAFIKSICDDIPEFCTWVTDGSAMHTSMVACLDPNDWGDTLYTSLVTDDALNQEDFAGTGTTIRKLVIVRNT